MPEMNCIRLQVWCRSVNVISIAFFSGAGLNADGMQITEFLSRGNAFMWEGGGGLRTANRYVSVMWHGGEGLLSTNL